MMTDLRFAFRQLLKSPGFTLLTLITIDCTAYSDLINDFFRRGRSFKLMTVYHSAADVAGKG